MGRREGWGYAVWGAAAVVVAVPEIWAAAVANAPWPTISGIVGALEYHHPWVAVVVVGAVALAALHAFRPTPDRTVGGRATATPVRREDIRAVVYFPIAVAAVVGGSALTHALHPDDRRLFGEVLYGLIALFWVVVPSVLAYAFAKDVPFPSLFATLAYLEARVRSLAYLVGAALAVLLIHLAFYPWPAIIPDLQDLHRHRPPSPYSP